MNEDLSKDGPKTSTSLLKIVRRTFLFAMALVAASIVTWVITTARIYGAVDLLVDDTLPALSYSREVQIQKNFIIDKLPQLHRVESLEDLDRRVKELLAAEQEIHQVFDKLKRRNITDLSKVPISDADVIAPFIEQQSEAIKAVISSQKIIAEKKIELAKLIEEATTVIDLISSDLENDIINTSAAAQKQVLNFKLLDFQKLQAQINGLSTLIVHAQSTQTLDDIERGHQAFNRFLRSAVALTVSINDREDPYQLSPILNEIYLNNSSASGLFQAMKERALARATVETNNQRISLALQELSDSLNTFSEEVSDVNQNALSQLSLALKSAIIILVILALLISLAFTFTYFKVIIQKIITPLRTLTAAIIDISQGKDDYQKFDTSSQELHAINEALLVFQANNRLMRHHEQQLIEKNRLLDRSNENLQTFTRVSSHDLKSPLRGIRLLCEMISEDVADKDFTSVGQQISEIDKRAERLNDLLDSLLEYSKAGAILGQEKELQLAPCIEEQIALLHRADAFKIDIDCQVAQITTYKAPFTMVIRNLVDNAIKHHDRKAGNITIEVLNKNENAIEIRITDDGPGIKSEYHQKVFQPFQTLKPRDEVEGSGMGLAILVKLVNGLGGSIDLVSPVANDRGTCFTVVWPTANPKDDSPETVTARSS